MFVFWYCHKRGKQVRLDREKATEAELKEGAENDEEEEEQYAGSDFEATDSDEGDSNDLAEKIATAVKNDQAESSAQSKNDILNQPEPSQVPLPDNDKGEKGAALEAEKSVGV